jgi:hypothetical protein
MHATLCNSQINGKWNMFDNRAARRISPAGLILCGLVFVFCFLAFEVFLIAGYPDGWHIGLCVDLVSVFSNADFFVEGVERDDIF